MTASTLAVAALVAAAAICSSQVALGYQLAPSCSCGNAYNLVANSVAQKYIDQQHQKPQYATQPPQQQQYAAHQQQPQYAPQPPQQQYAGQPPQYVGQPPQYAGQPPQYVGQPPQFAGQPPQYAGQPPQYVGNGLQQCNCGGGPTVRRVGPATDIETPPPVMQNPPEFGTVTYEEEPEGGQPVCQDCGGSPPPPHRVMTIPPKRPAYPVQNYAPPESNSVTHRLAQQAPPPPPPPQQYGGYPRYPMYATCPAAVLYPAPSLLYTPLVGPPQQPPSAAPKRPPPRPSSPPPTSDTDDDDGLLKTFTIHSASDPVDLNSVAAAVAKATATPPSPPKLPSPPKPPSCSMPGPPPPTKK